MKTHSQESAAAALVADPAWFPFSLDAVSDALLFARLEEEGLRAASFLDQRALGATKERRQVAWDGAAAAVAGDARRDVHYIFHIGHVGSTLMSRLLGESASVLALREPLLLRTFAEAMAAGRWGETEIRDRLSILTALLSRTFRSDQRALVKATSFTSEIADRLVPAGSRALFLHVGARTYIETILGGDASRQELAVLTPGRVARLAGRCPGLVLNLDRLTEAQKAMVGWACEMTSLSRSADVLGPDRVLWVDFDAFLAEPVGTLMEAAAFLGLGMDAAEAERLVTGPLMRRYSKALEYEYSPALRREVLGDARRRFGGDIEAALAGLAALGQRWPAIGAAIGRSGVG
ncbi:MAG TPA: hypothetical protein VGC56_01580 [Allosphingosinicella sp.]|jgi:hypothetical protein